MSTTTQTTTAASSSNTPVLHLHGAPVAAKKNKQNNCGYCSKHKLTQTTRHDVRNCPNDPNPKNKHYKGTRTAQDRTEQALAAKSAKVAKSAEVVEDEEEQQEEQSEDENEEEHAPDSGITPAPAVTIPDSGNTPAVTISDSGITPAVTIPDSGITPAVTILDSGSTAVPPTSSSSTASSSTTGEPSVSSSSTSSSGSKRAVPSSASSSSQRKKRQQKAVVVSTILGTEAVSNDSLHADIVRWTAAGNEQLVIAEAAQLLAANHSQGEDRVNERHVRTMIALYLASVTASNNNNTIRYQEQSLSMEEFILEVLNGSGSKLTKEEAKSRFYNNLKSGLGYFQLLRGGLEIGDLPNRTIAMLLAGACGRTDGRTIKPNTYNGQPFKPEHIPQFWKRLLDSLNHPKPTIKDVEAFIKKWILKPEGKDKGKGKGKGKGKPTKEEIIAALKEQVRELKGRLSNYEELDEEDEEEDEDEETED